MNREEFIGQALEVKSSGNQSLEGLKGVVVDETKKTFMIDSEGKQRTILKEGSVFLIAGKEVAGSDILQRPEDRIKTRR
jgi:ribonuclease P protein subunit POP4